MSMAYERTLEGWAHALELRDHDTEGHTSRTTELTVRLARAMGVNEKDLVNFYRGALLHDIGKIGVPDSIVLKPGPLTEDEWVIMRKHPQYAYDMLSSISYLRQSLDIPYCHHEKWDGTGYPRGLKGGQIPLSARIFAIVDVWMRLPPTGPTEKPGPKIKPASISGAVRPAVRSGGGESFHEGDFFIVQNFHRGWIAVEYPKRLCGGSSFPRGFSRI